MAAINAFYAQSGGATAVINATACGLIEEARRQHRVDPTRIGQVYAGRDGILGALREDLIDTSLESDADIARLRQTPGGAFGSSRFHLGPLATHRAMYERLAAVLAAHDIGYFFINGGEGSMGAAWHLSQMMREIGQPLRVIGIPKTVDNDMALTDCCPGFGSVAKYIATSVREAGYDVASMSQTSTKVFVLEVMGRHAGWITAAAGLASEAEGEPPHILLLPEVGFDDRKFLARVRHCVETYGYCVVVTAEGLCDAGGCNFGVSSRRAGTVGRYIADMVEVHLVTSSIWRWLITCNARRVTWLRRWTWRRRMHWVRPHCVWHWPAKAMWRRSCTACPMRLIAGKSALHRWRPWPMWSVVCRRSSFRRMASILPKPAGVTWRP